LVEANVPDEVIRTHLAVAMLKARLDEQRADGERKS
jgi:hypothetical protein